MTQMANQRLIYLDTAAATPLDPRVKKVLARFEQKTFGNPSSLHRLGREAKVSMEKARGDVAKVLGAVPSEIIFTSGGTESNNLALQSFPRGQVVTTNIEHSSVLQVCRQKELGGQKITYLKVDELGLVNPKQLIKAIKPETVLVSIHYANNEVGTVQPIKDLARLIKKFRQKNNTSLPYFHIDACQAPRFLPLDVNKLGVDLMTLNGSKIYGPKGVGLLYARRDVPLKPLLVGGGQEGGRRSGTENVTGILGLAEALKICQQNRESESNHLTRLRNNFWQQLKKAVPTAKLNGHGAERLPNNLSLTFPGVSADYLLLALDRSGVAVSLGSACSSRHRDPSYVIMALGRTRAEAGSTVRLSLGRDTTKSDLEFVLSIIKKYVQPA